MAGNRLAFVVKAFLVWDGHLPLLVNEQPTRVRRRPVSTSVKLKLTQASFNWVERTEIQSFRDSSSRIEGPSVDGSYTAEPTSRTILRGSRFASDKKSVDIQSRVRSGSRPPKPQAWTDRSVSSLNNLD